MGANIPIERLYLCKKTGNNVFIDNCSAYDHQIDSLRYLWKQFKKTNPGVVLSFPMHSGKSVTIVLFLYAIRKLLLQPVLILCKDGAEVEEWHNCLCQWTGFSSEDVVVQPTKALLKKQIFIKSMSDLILFTRRSWSILVYKNDEYVGLPQFSNVDFYIWATSTDVLKDLNFLSTIYNWMCPKAHMRFDDAGGDLKQLIFLDALLEDIVLRRTNINSYKDEAVDVDKTMKRSKNKDITGTKIKRSKVVQSNVICNKGKDTEMVENGKGNKYPVSRNESAVCDKLQQKMCDDNTGRCIVDCKKELSIDLPDNEEENTQSDICSLHYDETVSDIISHSCDQNVLEFNSKCDLNAVYSNEISSNTDNTNTYHNLKPESSTEKKDIKNNFELLQGVNNSDKLKEGKGENSEVSANIEQKGESIDILKSNKTETDINKRKKSSVIKDEDDLDSKLNEMEEKAMKKFQGSFLDSIF